MERIISQLRRDRYAILTAILVFLFFHFLFVWVQFRVGLLEKGYINAFTEIKTKDVTDSLGDLYRNIYLNFKGIKDAYLTGDRPLKFYVENAYKKGYYFSISLLKKDGTLLFTYPQGKREKLEETELKKSFSSLLFVRTNGYAVSEHFILSPEKKLLLPIYFFMDIKDDKFVLEGIVKYTELIRKVIEKTEKETPLVFDITVDDKYNIILHDPHKKLLLSLSYTKEDTFVRHPIKVTAYPTEGFYTQSMKNEKLFMDFLSIFFPLLFSLFVFWLLRYKNRMRCDKVLNRVLYKINKLLFEGTKEKEGLDSVLKVITEESRVDFVSLEKNLPFSLKEPLVIYNINTFKGNPKQREWLREKGLKSAVFLPLFGTKKHGVFVLGSKNRYGVFPDLMEFGKKFCDRLGLYFEIMETRNKATESEERYKQLIEDAPFGIRIVQRDKKGKMVIVYQNKKMGEITGYKNEEVVGKSPWDYVLPEDVDFIKTKIREEVEKKGLRREYEVRIRRKDGSIRYLSVFPKPIIYNGAPALFVYVRDITEKKNMEKELREKQKMETINSFTGGFAHNLNNFLTALQGYVELLRLKIGENSSPDVYRYLSNLSEIVAQIKGVTTSVLFLTRKRNYTITDVDIKKVIKDVISVAAMSKKGKDIEFVKLLDHREELIAKGDEGFINQALLNVVLNAIDAIEKRGKITISGAYAKDKVEIIVSDTGKGMDEETMKKVFDAFYTTKNTGSGLGLFTVKIIMNDLGGDIDIVSSEPGKGTTIKLSLPRGERLPDVKPEKEIEREKGKGETILLVDDEEIIIDAGKEMISALGYKVLATTDPYKALELYRKHKDEIKLVILDVVMPRMNGVELLIKIREMDKDARIILSSGYATDDLRQDLKDKGFEVKLLKPYDLETLSRIIKENLRD